jgi:hypothetical protein
MKKHVREYIGTLALGLAAVIAPYSDYPVRKNSSGAPAWPRSTYMNMHRIAGDVPQVASWAWAQMSHEVEEQTAWSKRRSARELESGREHAWWCNSEFNRALQVEDSLVGCHCHVKSSVENL